MAKAPIEKYFKMKDFEDVEWGIVYWPMSVLRTYRSGNPDRLIELGEKVSAWKTIPDETDVCFARTEENRIIPSPDCHQERRYAELDLVLRNNITFPLGVFILTRSFII